MVKDLRPESFRDVELTEGAYVTGKLLDAEGRGLGGYRIGVCQTDRTSDVFLGEFEIDTDEDGLFLFSNLPPGSECVIYADIESVGGLGAIEFVPITTGGDGELTEGVNLRVVRGHTLRGQVVLSDGKPIPDESVVMISCKTGWSRPVPRTLSSDGRFEFTALPTDSYGVYVQMPGYGMALANPNRVTYDNRIEGRIEGDISDFVILMEPGPFKRPERVDPATLPLRGYEGDFLIRVGGESP